MASPKFQFEGDIQQKCTNQRLLKKFIKQFAQKFKKFSKIFSKLKFNRIIFKIEHLIKF